MTDGLRGASVLVTGGTGFLGSHLTRRLIGDGARAHLAVRAESSFERLSDLREAVDATVVDLGNRAQLDSCVRRVRPDVVFHLAGTTAGRRRGVHGVNPDAILAESLRVNLLGTLYVLQAVRAESPQARVVRTGGLAEYGLAPVPFVEDERERPASAYAASQVAATHLGQAFAREHAVDVVTVRPALIYGPGQSESFLIPSLIRAGLEGRGYEMTSGEQTRDYVYVEDVVDALVRAAAVPGLAGSVINAGSGREYRIRDVAELVVRQTGGRTTLHFGNDPADSGDLRRLYCDTTRARHLLDWTATTPLEAGIAKTIDWYRQRVSATP